MNQKSVYIKIQDEPIHSHNARTRESLFVLGFDMNKFSKPAQFTIGTVAIFVFYVLYGYFLELIFRLEGFKPFGLYLTFIQFGLYSCFASLELKWTSTQLSKAPIKSYYLLALLTVATMALSNTSVGYLNYPTQVVFKCCKLIPTMIGSVLLQGKRYGCMDVASILCMTYGLIMFTLTDSTLQPDYNSYGILLISLALCADGALGNIQEKVMKTYSSSSTEMVFYSYFIGSIIILFGLVVSGQLFSGFAFCLQYPIETYGYGFLFSFAGYIGIQFVLLLVRSYGALAAVTVTTCRKAMTIILSFVLFTKPFSWQYVWSGSVVVLGIYLNLYSKNRKHINDILFCFYLYCMQKRTAMFSQNVKLSDSV